MLGDVAGKPGEERAAYAAEAGQEADGAGQKTAGDELGHERDSGRENWPQAEAGQEKTSGGDGWLRY